MSVINIKNIVFDLGGVLINWDPRHLFAEVFENRDELEHFLTHICSSDWNEEQDGGRSLREGTELLIKKHPNYHVEIRMFYGQWEKMLAGPIEENLRILEVLQEQDKYNLFALTNWSAETFPIALARYEFLQYFQDILVSGVEGMRKPELAFYQLMLDRFDILPEQTLFIDDNQRNVSAARLMGLHAIHLTPDTNLTEQLKNYGINLTS